MGRILMAALLWFSLHGAVAGQSENRLRGTWKLVSVESTTLKGVRNLTAFGPHPTGFATFTEDGRMSLIMSDDGRKPLSVVDRVSAPMAERAMAFATFVAYAGRYSVDHEKVIFHIEAASIQNWVNTDLARTVTLENNRLRLKTPTTLKGGVLQTIETDWEKLN
jgi:hypothetical protein